MLLYNLRGQTLFTALAMSFVAAERETFCFGEFFFFRGVILWWRITHSLEFAWMMPS